MHRIGKVCIAMNTSNKILIIKSCRKYFTCNDVHDILETGDTHLRSDVRVSCTFDLFHTNIGRSLGGAAHHVAKKISTSIFWVLARMATIRSFLHIIKGYISSDR